MRKIRTNTIDEILIRLLNRISKTSKGCWIIAGSGGYPTMKVRFPDGTVEWMPHRIAFRCYKGQIPKGKIVCHKRFCNDSSCCNPDHLYAGTYKENSADRDALGNGNLGRERPEAGSPGAKNGSAKLTDEAVLRIRTLGDEGMSARAISKLFDVSDVCIGHILRGKTWKHVKVSGHARLIQSSR